MSVKVYTYDDPKKWRSHPRYGEIQGAIHVCATKNVADGIREAYQKDESFRRIYTIREIISAMQPDWSSAETQLQQYLKLSKILKKHVAREADESIKESFRKNKKDILDTLRLLTYSGVGPSDLASVTRGRDDLSTKERMLINIWRELEEEDSSYMMLRKEMRSGWEPSRLLRAISKLEGASEESFDFDEKKLVLHGFYFITPEQQRFLECIRRGGLEIIFFNLFDERYPETFGFTRAFITERYGWSDDWEVGATHMQDVRGAGDIFLRAYEEGSAPTKKVDREIVAYESFFEFLNKVIVPRYPIGKKPGEDKVNAQIIATNADMLNDILSQYYPDLVSGNRNLLQYPVGQFLSKIHSIRTAEGAMLDEDILMALFTSGWLHDKKNGENARDYTGHLRKVLPYFDGCRTLDEWKKRSTELMELYEVVLSPYEKPYEGRLLKSMRSPFVRISQFSLEHQEMKMIQSFVEQVDSISKELFRIEKEEERIGQHFKKVFEMMSEHDPSEYIDLEEEEVRVLEKLSDRLGRIEDDTYFLYEDVSEAVNLYLSGKLDSQDSKMIKPFIEVDGEAFKEGKEYYVTGLDELGLPLGEFSLPWPFQPETYEALSERHHVLELDTLRNKSIKHISRYLFYITLQFLEPKHTELSFMRNYLDKKDLDPALYVKQLGLDVVFPGTSSLSKEDHTIRENAYDFEHEMKESRDGFEGLTHFDFLMEFVSCERRFYYGYVLSRFPTFSTDFHQQFQFTDLLRVVKRTASQDDERTVQEVGALFPGWTDYRKNMIAKKYILRKGVGRRGERLIVDGVSINDARQDLQLPGMTMNKREELRNKTERDKDGVVKIIATRLNSDLEFKPKPSKLCTYCPYQDICQEAKPSI